MDITLIEEQFYEHASFIKGYSKDTIRRYRTSLAYYKKISGVTHIHQVSEDNVRAFFFHGRSEKHWSPATFICYHKSMLVFFRWCVKQSYLKTNPVVDIEKPKPLSSLPKSITKQDAFKLLEIIYNFPYEHKMLRYRNHAIFSMFLFTGLRKNELLRLHYTDVDIENLSIFVRSGKGGKDRIIPISFTLAHSLKRYVEERKRLRRTCPEFFVSSNRNLGFTENGLKFFVEKVKKSSKLNFHIHQLRHTFATLMLEGGCDIYSLSKLLGHSDIKTTTIYLSTTAEHLRSQIIKHPLSLNIE